MSHALLAGLAFPFKSEFNAEIAKLVRFVPAPMVTAPVEGTPVV
jgi:uncharacterized membrane protein YdcZ (DUF606 family)